MDEVHMHADVDCVTGHVSHRELNAREVGERAEAAARLERDRSAAETARQRALGIVRTRVAEDPAFAALVQLLGIDVATPSTEAKA